MELQELAEKIKTLDNEVLVDLLKDIFEAGSEFEIEELTKEYVEEALL